MFKVHISIVLIFIYKGCGSLKRTRTFHMEYELELCFVKVHYMYCTFFFQKKLAYVLHDLMWLFVRYNSLLFEVTSFHEFIFNIQYYRSL